MFKDFIKTCQTYGCNEVADIKENDDKYFCSKCALKRQIERDTK
jgi:hypothetical protein